MVAKKVFGDEKGAVRGYFRDPNIGYTLGFTRRALGNMTERWKFEVRYMRGWWNLPTSQPGPGGTGNSSFIVKVTSGLAMMRTKLLNPQKLAARL
ncbi:hypothetical protein GGS24DRAFT_464671 [Hypoxylon argillaceum]|nr:hypothetical protein GGS24DRAFT_464671 [Hypoxylon argillaceum]